MATAVHQFGITNTTPGGSSRTVWAPQQQTPHPSGVLYQLPGQLLQSTAQNYGSMAGGLGGIGQAIGGMGGMQSQALANLGNAFAQNYGAYGSTVGNIANAAAQDSTGYYNSLSGAAQANQAGLANMWTQALASLGGMGNALADSMGRGQVGYQNALAGMQGANQGAVSQFGQARMNNIGRLGAADAVSGMQFDFGGGGGGGNQFQAAGPDGQIASGSYGGGMGGGMSGSGGRTPANMGPYMDAMMDGSVLSQLASSDMDARDRLDNQQDLYRQDYGNMFSQGLLGMLNMGREGAGTLRQGMQDFYGSVGQNRPSFGQYLDSAASGFRDSSRDIRGVGNRMSRDYGAGLGALAGLAGQIGAGMREVNDTGMAGVKDMLSRFAPTPQEQARNNYETTMLQRQQSDMLNADARRRMSQYTQSPEGMSLGASRIRQEARYASSPQERARLYAMARAREAMA